jgi:hypothetical protein
MMRPVRNGLGGGAPSSAAEVEVEAEADAPRAGSKDRRSMLLTAGRRVLLSKACPSGLPCE